MTRRELSVYLRVSGNYIYMIETCRALPSPRLLKQFSEFFGFNYELAKLFLFKDKVDQFAGVTRKKLQLPDIPGKMVV